MSDQQDNGPGAGKAKGKGRKGGSQLMPTLITAVLILALSVAYFTVRQARHAVAPAQNAPHGKAEAGSRQHTAGRLQVSLPDSWRFRRQGGVQGGASRYAAGPAGATDQALFITRYPLRRAPRNDRERRQVLSEARVSLQRTGAPKLQTAEKVKLAGRDAWRHRYRQGRLTFSVFLVIDERKDGTSLYQIACQSRRGEAGRNVRDGCREAISDAEMQ